MVKTAAAKAKWIVTLQFSGSIGHQGAKNCQSGAREDIQGIANVLATGSLSSEALNKVLSRSETAVRLRIIALKK